MLEDNLQSPISNRLYCQTKSPARLLRDERGFRGTTLFDGLCISLREKHLSGPKGARTLDLYNAIVALSQLSYGPVSISEMTTFYFNPVAHFVQKYSIVKTIHSGA